MRPVKAPPTRLSVAALAIALLASVAVAWAAASQVDAERTAMRDAAHRTAVERQAERAARAMEFALALGDTALAQDVAQTLLDADADLDSVRVTMADGGTIAVGEPGHGLYTAQRHLQHESSDVDALLLGDRPLVDATASVSGTVVVTADAPAGPLHSESVQGPLPIVLGALVIAFLAVGAWLRHRVRSLCQVAAALGSGDFRPPGAARGNDEFAWATQRLSDLSDVLRTRMDGIECRNAELRRDVTIHSTRLERLAGFAARLVAPLGEAEGDRHTLDVLVEETGAKLAVLLLPTPGTGALKISATVGCGSEPVRTGQETLDLHQARTGEGSSVLAPLSPEHPWMRAGGRHVTLEGVAALPLMFRGRLEAIAVLAAHPPWSEADRGFLDDVAHPLGIALANRRAYRASVELTDALETRNDALVQQRDELEVVSRMRNQFVANISHELRTPLNAIIGYSELLADECYGEITEIQRTALESVGEAGTHLLALVNQVLDLSRAEAGELTLEIDVCDLRQVAEEVVRMSLPLCRERPYVPRVVGTRCEVETDRERVCQILTNLVGNAIKFTPSGSLTVRIEATPDGGAVIAIEDTGIGIDEGHMELIFEEFRQADGTATRAHDGAGLGLAISRRLVGALGGTLTVRSEPGSGSCFSIHLPARAPERAQPSGPSAALARAS